MNYYELLEVSPNASKEVLRAAYKSLMQRYHPDKNLADSTIASRAALIVQAYEVLSDSEKRAAYDAQMRKPLPAAAAMPRAATAPYSRRAAPAKSSNWYLWLLATVIVVAGLSVWSLSKKKPAPPAAAGTLLQSTSPPPPAAADAVATAAKESPATTSAPQKISLLTSDLTVVLLGPDNLPEDVEARRHAVSIPALTVDIGSIEAEKFASLLEREKDSVRAKLAEKLAHAKYAELGINGDKYLNKLIYDALREITGTQGLDDSSDPTDTRRYGIIAVALPASFSLR
ncbi:J domain-containing protein [Rhodoferax sp.]|uniref:J domain-containing protein n=1 Tax=Rhodoferax sp. TaxID=50421 RepID=UPI00374CD51C